MSIDFNHRQPAPPPPTTPVSEAHVAQLANTLTILVFGESKVGKSTFAMTSPAPRVVLDVEKGTRFIPGLRIVTWDPRSDEPPVEDGTWDTCLVDVHDYDTVLRAYQWILSGRTPFRSVIIDSISELQAKVIEKIAGRNQVKMQDWGDILRHITGLLRDMRDMVALPTNKVECLVMIAMAREFNGKKTAYLQGQSAVVAPFIVDICGYLTIESFPHEDPTLGRYSVRRLHISDKPDATVGERVGGRLGAVVEQADLNLTSMIRTIYATPAGSSAGSNPQDGSEEES
jgi:AAA domain